MIAHTLKYLKLLLLVVAQIASLTIVAQKTATVYGVINDDSNNPIEDVSISVSGSSQAPVYTDKKGAYSYLIPAEKEVTIVFSSLSHKVTKQIVKLSENEKKN